MTYSRSSTSTTPLPLGGMISGQDSLGSHDPQESMMASRSSTSTMPQPLMSAKQALSIVVKIPVVSRRLVPLGPMPTTKSIVSFWASTTDEKYSCMERTPMTSPEKSVGSELF